jgi:Flp pilus assembly protein TadG
MVEQVETVSRKRRSERGTTIVEATIVLPLMLMLVFAIAELGISYTRWNNLTNAVREGARTGVVFRSPCDAGPVTTVITDAVSEIASRSGIDPTNITTTVTGACTGTGTQLSVTATVPYNYIALSGLAGLAPSTDLSARTVMRNE